MEARAQLWLVMGPAAMGDFGQELITTSLEKDIPAKISVSDIRDSHASCGYQDIAAATAAAVASAADEMTSFAASRAASWGRVHTLLRCCVALFMG